jgi:hypothetical protein
VVKKRPTAPTGSYRNWTSHVIVQLGRPTKETAGPMYRALPVSRQVALTGGRGVVRVVRRVSFQIKVADKSGTNNPNLL